MEKPKIYTGVGNRTTPRFILEIFEDLAQIFANNGYILRSGGAVGADLAFEHGCNLAGGDKEIYLPFKGYNQSNSNLFEVTRESLDLAKSRLGSSWNFANMIKKKMMARNNYQVLGLDLKTPTDLVICYAKTNNGGTRYTMNLAKDHGIPVFNLGNEYIFPNVDKQKEIKRILIEKFDLKA